ncbi:hypothetical protein N9L52_06105 [Litoricolaceae bacterium]|nr:hypothetical protein [Litorivicinaceae bacterium]
MIVFAELGHAERIVDRVRDLQGFFSSGAFEIDCKGKYSGAPNAIFSIRKTLLGDIEIRLKQGINWLAITPRSFSDAGVLFNLNKSLDSEVLSIGKNVMPTNPAVRSLIFAKGHTYKYQWTTTDTVDISSKIGMDFELDFVEQQLRSKDTNYSHPAHDKAEGIFSFKQLKSDVRKDLEDFKQAFKKISKVIDQLRNDMPIAYGNYDLPGTALYRAKKLEGFANELFKLGDKVISTEVGRELWLSSFKGTRWPSAGDDGEGWPRSIRYDLSYESGRAYDAKTGVPKVWHNLASGILTEQWKQVRGYGKEITAAEWKKMKPVIVERWIEDLGRVLEIYSSIVIESFSQYDQSLPKEDILISPLEFHFESLSGIGIYANRFNSSDCRLLGH